MKVTVHNLGVIAKAEIDLKPLTIFVGPNNTGKTWLAYTLAGIFGPYGLGQFLLAYEEEGVPNAYETLDYAIKQVLNKGSASFDLVKFAKDFGEKYFNNVASLAQNWMPEYMSTAASFQNLDILIDLAETKTDFLKQILNYSLISRIPGGQQKPLLRLRKKRGDSKLFIYTFTEYASSEDILVETEDQTVEPLPSEIIKEFLVRNVFAVLHRALYPNVRILPTERTAFITFPSGRRKVVGGVLSIETESFRERKLKAMISPVSQFMSIIRSTSEHELGQKGQREKDAKFDPKIREYMELAQLLEEQILSGEVKFFQQNSDALQSIPQSEVDTEREVLFQPTKDRKLEISIASSMVKELSPLVLYLRYLAKPGELLVIDEPEMNLHPEAQVKITEFLAILINAGLNVLITTHSPYVIDHLTNLIKAAEAEDKESIRSEFYLKRTDAFISKDKVSVYLFDQGHATKVIDEKGVIQLSTFGEVSDHISDTYFNLE